MNTPAGTTMKALILKDTKKATVTDIQTPTCGANETLLKVTHCAICRTDAKAWSQGQRDLLLPRVLGHEISGQNPTTGEQFIVWPAATCNSCEYCRNGKENLCKNIQVIGFHRDGGLAQYISAPTASLIKIPPTLPSEVACMTELMSSAINAIEQVNLQKNQKVLIYGGGPAGLLLALACKYYDAVPFVVEKKPAKIQLAAKFCQETGVPISIAAPFDGFDVAINAAPDPNTFVEGVRKLKPSGKYCLFSGFTSNQGLSTDLLNEVHYRQLTLVGAYGSTKRQMETALKIFEANPEKIKLLIHKIVQLAEAPAVFPEILGGKALKYIVKM